MTIGWSPRSIEPTMIGCTKNPSGNGMARRKTVGSGIGIPIGGNGMNRKAIGGGTGKAGLRNGRRRGHSSNGNNDTAPREGSATFSTDLLWTDLRHTEFSQLMYSVLGSLPLCLETCVCVTCVSEARVKQKSIHVCECMWTYKYGSGSEAVHMNVHQVRPTLYITFITHGAHF